MKTTADPTPSRSSRPTALGQIIAACLMALTCLMPALGLGLAASLTPTPALAQPPQVEPLPAWEWSRSDIQRMERMGQRAERRGNVFVVQSPHWEVNTDVSARFATEVAYYLEMFYVAIVADAEFRSLNDSVLPRVEIYADSRLLNQRLRAMPGAAGFFNISWDDDEDGDEDGDFDDAYLILGLGSRDNAEFPTFILSPQGDTLRHEATHALLQMAVGTNTAPSWFHEAYANYYQYWDTRLNSDENHRRIVSLIYADPFWQKTFEEKKTPRLEYVIRLRDGYSALNAGAGGGVNYAVFPTLYDAMRTERQAEAVRFSLLNRIKDDQTNYLVGRETSELETGWHRRLAAVYREFYR